MGLYLGLAMAALAGGIVQGVTGFGAGIVIMMVLPYYFSLPESAGISGAICIFLCASMAITYRKYTNFKKIILPCVLYLLTCSVAISFSTVVNQALMKKVFGVFLLALAIYYLFLNKNTQKSKMSLLASVFCIVISGCCDGLFGIGGPLMVLYFLNQTDTSEEYLGTIQSFFLINCIYNTGFRVYSGILGIADAGYVLLGVLMILAGAWIADKIVSYLNPDVLKKLTYVMIGISGLMNLL
jgi:hypothetical protein